MPMLVKVSSERGENRVEKNQHGGNVSYLTKILRKNFVLNMDTGVRHKTKNVEVFNYTD